MRLTIVTPSYNQGAYIERTLRSVHEPGYADLEHWVIDGGSTDATVDVLKRYEDRLDWISEKDGGQADAVNKGFRRATGEVIGWLNSDDTYVPGTLDKVMALFAARPEIDLVCGDCNMIDEADRLLRTRRAGPFDLRKLVRMGVSYVFQPTVFFRRSLLDAAGECDASLRHGMDYDLWCRMGRYARPCYLPEPLANWRYQPESKTCSERHVSIAEGRMIRKRYSRGLVDLPWSLYYDLRVKLYLLAEPLLLRGSSG